MPKHTVRDEAARSSGDRRSALEAWLMHADQVLAEQRAHSISPSFAEALAADQQYETVLSMKTVSDGLEQILERLLTDPGRWILILTPRADTDRYVQYLLYEDGSLVAEAVSNRFLEEPSQLSDEDECLLAALGWQAPTGQRRPNWQAVQETLTPDITAAASLGIETLRTVFRVDSEDLLHLKMFSSPKRGGTPASTPRSAGSEGFVNLAETWIRHQSTPEEDPWEIVRAQQWDELDGMPSAIDVNRWAARAARALLIAEGLAAEIDQLRRIDPGKPTPAVGLEILLSRADLAATQSHEAADRVRAAFIDEELDPSEREELAVRCAHRALDVERAGRQIAQLLMGVNACYGDSRSDVRDRSAVSVIFDPFTGAGLATDGIELFASTDGELLPEIAGLICRLIIEPETEITLGQVELGADRDGKLIMAVAVDRHEWESPVRVYEPASLVVAELAGEGRPIGSSLRR